MDLNQFIAWQAEKPSRSVKIEIGGKPRTNYIEIWVYDYDLVTGQHVSSVDEIDLEAKKEENEKAQYEELKKKFENKKATKISRKEN